MDEALFRSAIHPNTQAAKVSRVRAGALHQRVHAVVGRFGGLWWPRGAPTIVRFASGGSLIRPGLILRRAQLVNCAPPGMPKVFLIDITPNLKDGLVKLVC